MSEAEKMDVSQPATLRYGTKLIDCPTLGEAVLAFDRLPEGDREQATVLCGTHFLRNASRITDRQRRGCGAVMNHKKNCKSDAHFMSD